MAEKPLDLVIYRENRQIERLRVVADPDDPTTIRKHLLAVAAERWNDTEQQIGKYAADVHRAGYGMKEFTYRTVPGGK